MTKKELATKALAALTDGLGLTFKQVRDALDEALGQQTFPTMDVGEKVNTGRDAGTITGYKWDYPRTGRWMYIVTFEDGKTAYCWPQDFK